jgi:hypothetical protein
VGRENVDDIGPEALLRSGRGPLSPGRQAAQAIFRQQVYACSVPTLTAAHCPGVKDELDVFGEFEDEVRGISGRRARR